MSSSATSAMRKFEAHVEEQEQLEDRKGDEHFKEARQLILQELLTALELNAAQIQSKLAIGRATWDRWRAATHIPRRSHLEALARFAAEKDAMEDSSSRRSLPPPLRLLSDEPYSWGQIKLMYTVYPWYNAVFKFKEPYIQEDTAFEMLLLAFRSCKLIYIMPCAQEWCANFIKNTRSTIGGRSLNRALKNICVIDIPENHTHGLEYGLFNYDAEDEDDSVGYVWQHPSSSAPPSLSQQHVYLPVHGRSDSVYGELKKVYGTYLEEAFAQTIKRENLDPWSASFPNQTGSSDLKIPAISFGQPDKINFFG